MPPVSPDPTQAEPGRELVPAAPASTGIRQRAIAVDAGQRTRLLRYLMEHNGWHSVLVFVATKHAAEMVADKLRKAGLSAEPLHDQLSPGKRTQVVADFKAERLRVVVATEAAVRDLALATVLVNYDLPRSTLNYNQRLRCSGGASANGVVLSFVSADTEAHFSLIEKRQGLPLPREQIAGFEPRQAPGTAAPSTGGIKGKRANKKDKLRATANPGP